MLLKDSSLAGCVHLIILRDLFSGFFSCPAMTCSGGWVFHYVGVHVSLKGVHLYSSGFLSYRASGWLV